MSHADIVGMVDSNSPPDPVPTLYEWAGGLPAFERLTELFYTKVKTDPLLAPVFATMNSHHPQHVAGFIAEIFGGPKSWTSVHGEPGGHAAMVARHFNRALT